MASGTERVRWATLGLSVVTVLAFLLSGAATASPVGAAAPHAIVHPTSGSTQQWAFGGTASDSFSCSDTTCTGGEPTNLSLSLSLRYYLEWVVIYTQTNVSSTQTMIEGQTALNASATLDESVCEPTGSSGPCQSSTVSANLAGKETAVGFTNITSGSVNLTSSSTSPLGTTAALAVMNAASQESLNFSGTVNYDVPVNGTPESGTITFDIGGSESSSVSFAPALGLVPSNPQPGDTWTSSAPYSASGSWKSGWDLSSPSYSSEGNWTSGTVSPSGTLFVNGSDLGAYTLYDNYTNPATSVTAQAILLDFGEGSFSAADGWVMVPVDVYNGVDGVVGVGLGGVGTLAGGVSSAAHILPAAAGTTSITSSETPYYERGSGFIGVSETGTAPIGGAGSSPTISLRAGPEPVSVAQGQYNAITTGSASGSGSGSGFPWTLVVVAAVVVVAALALAALMVRRGRRRNASGMTPYQAPAAMGGAPGGPAAPSGGPTGPTTGTAAAAAGGAMAAPACPSCGQPATYVAQYGRYYCYGEGKYL
jgi:hypothetical protein